MVDVEGRSDKGEINLLVLMRNTGQSAVDFTYKSWPEEEQSKCSLQIENLASKKRVEAKEVPIAKKDIVDYFSKHGRSYQTKIEPGESHLHRLPRVTTAGRGWGYKEELGFRYYPLSQPGEHSISAECSNLLGPGSVITTEALTVTL